MSVVDYRGNVILDTYVSPTMQVSDYRTATTGIEACHLLVGESTSAYSYPAGFLYWRFFFFILFSTDVGDTPTFDRVQQHVAELIKGKVIIGHSLWHDLSGRVHAYILVIRRPSSLDRGQC